MTDVKVVAPINMGKGIVWNEQTKQYDVALGAGLYIDDNGVIQMRSNEPKIQTFDNGTSTVYHKQIKIDYGSVVEISGRVVMPLPTQELIDLQLSDYGAWGVKHSSQDPTQPMWGLALATKATLLGLTTPRRDDTVYYTESRFDLNYIDLGISEVLSVSVTSGDTVGYKAEAAWAIDMFDTERAVSIGTHVYFLPEENSTVLLNYTIKGLKA